MRLKELSEADFEVLRKPLLTGRQSPSSLGANMIIATFLQALMLFLIYYLGGKGEYESLYPFKNQIFITFLVYTSTIMMLCIVYSFKYIWKNYENAQYILSVIISQTLFGKSWYLIALFLTGHSSSATTLSLVLFTFATLLIGFLVLYFTYKRFLGLLTNGEYRRGSKKEKIRVGVEEGVNTNKSIIIVLSVALLFILQFLIRNIGISNFENIFLIVLGLGLFYTMLFVLPEQLVIYYCKRRFASFRFNEAGEINPIVSSNPRKHEASINKRKKHKK